MTLLRIRELTACARHRRVLVHMEDADASQHFSFSAEPEDARRLAREMARGPRACHPVFDFIQALLQSWRAAPVRVVLEDVDGEGIGALVVVRHDDVESSIACYPPDALTLALRTGVPIYAAPGVLGRAHEATEELEAREWIENVRPQDFEP